MAVYERPPYADWTPERLQKSIKVLQEKRDPLLLEITRLTHQLNESDAAIRELQFVLIANSGLRDSLRGWGPKDC